ncbi:hypothetical protein TMES_17280 [Thalassospira mesophila]|uniref:Uncharacterized protein n=1 Tax=Thalassospira mesophila TaxID=1293891 RepID=A0A1Y2KX85_9PROT|nr:hypothetical protein TMES_17280 [Thalassospira mesophila]
MSISPLIPNLAAMAGFGKPNSRNFAHMARMHGLNGTKCAKPRRGTQGYVRKIRQRSGYVAATMPNFRSDMGATNRVAESRQCSMDCRGLGHWATTLQPKPPQGPHTMAGLEVTGSSQVKFGG